MPKVNPKILQWARETAGLSIEDAAKLLGIRKLKDLTPEDRIKALESGYLEPARPLLLKMVKKYRRPLLIFYMSHPPNKGDRGVDFRTLPDDYMKPDEMLLDALLRDVLARQSMVRAVLIDEDEGEKINFVDSVSIADNPKVVSASIIETLGLDINEYRSQPSPQAAFKLLRNKVEATGVFVLLIGNLGSYHTNIDVDTFRGYVIADDIAPFVIINDNDSRWAWSFTLLHELVHIWLGQTGISGFHSDIDIERFCNEVVGNLLLPFSELTNLDISESTPFVVARDRIYEFARSRNVSSSMVAYKLHLAGYIDIGFWKKLNSAYREIWLKNRDKRRSHLRKIGKGPSYYVIRRHRLGTALIQFVNQFLIAGSLTTSKAGKVLGVRAKNVQTLIETSRPAVFSS